VLHVLSADGWGGTEVQVAEQLRRREMSQCHQALAVLDSHGELHHQLRYEGVEVHALEGGRNFSKAIWRLARLIRIRPWDLVEAYGFRASVAVRLAQALTLSRPTIVMGVRNVHMVETEEVTNLKSRLVLAVERRLSWTVTCYDANSRGAVEFLVKSGFPSEKFRVIPNGVSLPEGLEAATRHEQPTIVSVARFVSRKRHEHLIRAVAVLRDRGHNVRCVLIGTGPTLESCRRFARELGVDEHVEMLGELSQPNTLQAVAAADVFALCSLWEGLPGSVLEAMALGLPVVATKVSGTSEVVVDEATGFLVPVDDIEALAGALARVLSDAALRQRMGEAAKTRATQYSFERVVQAKDALYRELA